MSHSLQKTSTDRLRRQHHSNLSRQIGHNKALVNWLSTINGEDLNWHCPLTDTWYYNQWQEGQEQEQEQEQRHEGIKDRTKKWDEICMCIVRKESCPWQKVEVRWDMYVCVLLGRRVTCDDVVIIVSHGVWIEMSLPFIWCRWWWRWRRGWEWLSCIRWFSPHGNVGTTVVIVFLFRWGVDMNCPTIW